jgi:c-di-GMP-binding flagellar brake protein YcgR
LIRRRTSRRYGKNGTVAIRRVVTEPHITGSLFDLSVGGALIWLDDKLDITPPEYVEVKLQTDNASFRLMGTIRHISEANRLIGVEFLKLPVKESEELARFIAALEAAAAIENSTSKALATF